mmetsp:Transcript_27688/g.58822  ORF Transcript_27688/g.58822 Transcript_27688/m.58822 type:complete len:295 (-) Transcript_27688:3-887(-)
MQSVATVAPLNYACVALPHQVAIFVPYVLLLLIGLVPPPDHVVDVPPVVLLLLLHVVRDGVVGCGVDANDVGELGDMVRRGRIPRFASVVAGSSGGREIKQFHLTRGDPLLRFLFLRPLASPGAVLVVVAVAVQSQLLVHALPDRGDVRLGTLPRPSHDAVIPVAELVVLGRLVLVVPEQGAVLDGRSGVVLRVPSIVATLRLRILSGVFVAVLRLLAALPSRGVVIVVRRWLFVRFVAAAVVFLRLITGGGVFRGIDALVGAVVRVLSEEVGCCRHLVFCVLVAGCRSGVKLF